MLSLPWVHQDLGRGQGLSKMLLLDRYYYLPNEDFIHVYNMTLHFVSNILINHMHETPMGNYK